MQKNFRVALILIALSLPFINMPESVAQLPNYPIVGGYTKFEKTAKSVVKAAKFAVNTQKLKQRRRLSLVSIERAETQVVAGINYKLCLKVKNNQKIQEVIAVVYQDLQQKYSLSSWKVESCKKSS